MASLMQEVIALSKRAKAVMDRYEADKSKLFDRRGFERFPAEEHKKRIDDLKQERNEALRSIEARANEIAAAASREAERASQFAPDTVLDGLQRGALTSRLPLIEADVAALGVDELAERLEGILRDGSPAEKFGYTQVAKKRRREILERQAKAAQQVNGGRAVSTPQTRTTPLDFVLRSLEKAVLGREAERRAALWLEVAREASKVSRRAFLGARDAQSLAGVVAQRHTVQEFAERQRREPVVHYATSAGGRIANATRHD